MGTSPKQALQEFVSLLTDHQEVLRSYIISQLPGSPDTRDVLQEVNIRLWEKMGDFKMGTNFGAWACTVAYYKIQDHRKKLKKERKFIFGSALSETLAMEAQSVTSHELDCQRDALKLCMAQLPEKDQALLVSRYTVKKGGMDQLVTETGRSKASLRVSLCRLRATLRQCITDRLNAEGGRA